MEYVIFVYGTLRRGFGNHGYLRNARFLGAGWTTQPYALYCADVPYVIEDERQTAIRGELYAVDAPTFRVLDILEDHPNEYIRQEVTVALDDGTRRTAWLYFGRAARGQRQPSGDYAG